MRPASDEAFTPLIGLELGGAGAALGCSSPLSKAGFLFKAPGTGGGGMVVCRTLFAEAESSVNPPLIFGECSRLGCGRADLYCGLSGLHDPIAGTQE